MPPPGVSEAGSKSGIAKELIEFLRERGFVAWIDEQCGYAVGDDLGDRGHSGGDDWKRRGHRFEEDDAEAFLLRRKREDAGVSILGGEGGE